MLFDPTNCQDEGLEVSVYPPGFVAEGGPITVDYYTGTDYSGGVSFTISNRAYYGPSNITEVAYNATGSNKGTLFSQNLIPSEKKTGGSASDLLEFVPFQKYKILLEFDNTGESDAILLIQFVWFEV
jgi:hypothetical protein